MVTPVWKMSKGEYLYTPCMKCDYSFLSYLNYTLANSQETVLAIKFDNKIYATHICSPKHFLVWPNSKGYQAKCTINSTHSIIIKVVKLLFLQLDVSRVYTALGSLILFLCFHCLFLKFLSEVSNYKACINPATK